MDDRRFDSLVMTLTTDGSRRGILHALGGSVLVTMAARLGLADDAEAKKKRKKKKKCKGNTTKCGKKACCRADQQCINGKCVDDVEDPECVNDDDCGVGTGLVCRNGNCEIDVAPFCQANEECESGEECFAGVCVRVAGTCAATDDHCSAIEALCNPEAGDDCFCVQRFSGGGACIEKFVPETFCGSCLDDVDCAGIEEGSVCVSAVTVGASGCPCDLGEGICARLCLNQ